MLDWLAKGGMGAGWNGVSTGPNFTKENTDCEVEKDAVSFVAKDDKVSLKWPAWALIHFSTISGHKTAA